MTSIREAIARTKGDTSYWEDRLKELVKEFEFILKELKGKADNEIKKVIEDSVFADLSEPSKKLAQQVAKEEISKFKSEITERIKDILQNIKTAKREILQKVDNEIDNTYSDFMDEVKKLLEATTKESAIIFENLETEIREKIETIETDLREQIRALSGPQGEKGDKGENSDPEIVANIVLSKLPKPEEFTAETIVEKISSLSEEKKISMSSIKGLNEWLQNLNRAIREKTKPQGSSGGGMGNIQHETFNVNSSTTTITTTYPIAGGGFAVWGYYNGSQIHRGTHFTVGSNKKILTLTFTPDDTTPSAVITLVYVRGA